MEDKFCIAPTAETPEVILDKTKNEFRITGKSMPENAYEFFTPIQNWLDEYSKNPNRLTKFDFSLDYFNSGSVKQVFRILCQLEELTEQGKEVEVNWFYRKGDELMLSKGLEFDKFLDLNIAVKEK